MKIYSGSILRTQRGKGSSRQRGFTLLEVLVTIVLATVGLVATNMLVIGTIRGNQISRHVTAATTLVQDLIEVFKNTSYANIPGNVTNPSLTTAACPQSFTCPAGNTCTCGGDTGGNINARGTSNVNDGVLLYSRTFTVAENTTVFTKTITVTVTWPFNGITKQRSLTTVISQ